MLALGKASNALKQEDKRAELARVRATFGVLVEAFVAKALVEGIAEAALSKTVWLLDSAKSDVGHLPTRLGELLRANKGLQGQANKRQAHSG